MKKIPWWLTEISEAEKNKLLSAFDNKHFSLGPVVKELEQQLAEKMGVPHVLVTNSGTSALMIAMLTIGLQPDEEVIVPDFTWIATAQPVTAFGGKTILVDSLPDVPLIDPDEVRKKITSRTKAIILVHFHGRPCDLKTLQKIADDHGLFLIEDACKAMFSKSNLGYLGTVGDIGCFSMGMISLLSVGYGGFVVIKDESLFEKARLIRDHGVSRKEWDVYETMGLNFKISDLLAAIGLAQLEKLEDKLMHINQVYDRYKKGLASLSHVELSPIDIDAGQIPLCIDVYSEYRDDLVKYLDKNNVGTAKLHPPLHSAAYFKQNGNYPNATRFAKNGVMLPCGPNQPLENIDHCLELLQDWKHI